MSGIAFDDEVLPYFSRLTRVDTKGLQVNISVMHVSPMNGEIAVKYNAYVELQDRQKSLFFNDVKINPEKPEETFQAMVDVAKALLELSL